MFKQKTNLRKCIKTLEGDLKDNQIHPSTIWNAIHCLENKDIIKFFKRINSFYTKNIKKGVKKKDPLTLHNVEAVGGVDKYIEDLFYSKIAHSMPTNPNCERTDLYDLFPKLKKYVEYRKAEEFNESIGDLF